MNQTGNQSNLQMMLVIGMVVLIIITATSLIVGSQVYWWQKSIAANEKNELKRQINSLQNELAFLREDLGRSLLQKSNRVNSKSELTDEIYINSLAGMEHQVITALKNREMMKLASLVHPEKGIRFSPYPYVDTRSDLIFTSEKLKNFFKDTKQYVWGYYDHNGMPIRMTTREYFDNYIFDGDYSTADEVNYNATIGRSLTVSNIFEVYPRSIVVEFGKDQPSSTSEERDWRSIRLVFEKNEDTKWYLVGILHDRWKI